ncbi:MAG: precorrin-4 C(11)-methyltransferase [Desulfobacula sp. RIFOXYB2_FULL_45_6]|nr:MAG: precorrin-4 C(11)-methyltransferase [Desulfobacula sp. RIFOXYB2_FULL_45_6]
MEDTNKVIFAGAGPGDPELITVKAMNALKTSDLIIYAGSLVPEAVLCWKGEKTKTVSSQDMDLTQIIDTIRKYYSMGQKIIRLHTGDPALYGAIFEQMRELEKYDIPYEVIPGVTAAFAASAKMKMEYTLPEETQTLILTRVSGRTPVPDSEDLEKLASHKSSLVIYLSIGHAKKVQSILETHYGKDSLCAVAFKVSHPEEKIIYTKIKHLLKTCEENQITRHALIIVGKSVEASINPGHVLSSKLYDPGFSHEYRTAQK